MINMAVTLHNKSTKFKIVYSLGADKNGKEIKKTKTYSNLKHDVSNEDVYAVASALIGLQSKTALEVAKLNETELVDK
jgi:hypothetical protein